MSSDSRLSETELYDLEILIDKRGAEDVLVAISEICGAKAEHVKVNWQDLTLALRWSTLEGAVGCIVPKAAGL
jgi:hypothetical protein